MKTDLKNSHLKFKIHLLLLSITAFIFMGCPTDESPGGSLHYLRATVEYECLDLLYFIGDDIYGYSLEDGVLGTYWQLGGHPNGAVNEEPDLGINVFLAELETGNYNISSTFMANSALVYYTDENGNHFVSKSMGTINLTKTPAADWNKINIKINNTELYNPDLDVTVCLNDYDYQYTIPK